MYRVIYDAIDEIEAAMKGMLAPKYREAIIGHAEVRQTYKVSAVGTIAGCYVKDGKITRDSQGPRAARTTSSSTRARLAGLQRFKDSVKEVQRRTTSAACPLKNSATSKKATSSSASSWRKSPNKRRSKDAAAPCFL